MGCCRRIASSESARPRPVVGGRSATMVSDTGSAGAPDPALMSLGAGERKALLLVQELGADAFLTDDLEGRQEALQRGMQVTGTLGILERAALRDLIDLPTAITRPQATTFHPPAEIIAAMLARDATRNLQPPT